MRGARPQFIWRGRLHLGDEPGVYGDAQYVGLGCDLPLTIREFAENPADTPVFVLSAEGVGDPRGYPGHAVEVVLYEEGDEPNRYGERVLARGRLANGQTEVEADLGAVAPKRDTPRYVSVRVRLDTSVPPALYDDLVLTGLSLRSAKYYASFGFH